jgi:hypothetical protein
MKKILVLTSLKPDKNNKGGPSGLIWECLKVMDEFSIKYDLKVINSNCFLNKLGIYTDKISDLEKYDKIIVYPFNLYFKIKKNFRYKVILIGPDSPSLLFLRFYKTSVRLKLKIKYFILFYWFKFLEKKVLSNVNIFCVVGRNDTRWLKINNSTYKNKIKYLTHPILTSIIENIQKKHNKSLYNYKTLIFAGDMSPKYTFKYIIDFISVLNKINFHILIVGKNNKWIYELYNQKIIDKSKLEFVEWIENYNDICNPLYHIHFIPLAAGAGTKNRTLTACATGVTIISTSIGLENILYGKPLNKIYKFKNVNELQVILNTIELPKEYFETQTYISNINIRFKNELLNIIQGK